MEELRHEFARCVALVIEGIAIATRRGQVEMRVISLECAHWLAAVAAIRTFPSYFLDYEMETTRRPQQARLAANSRADDPQCSV